MQLPLPNPLKSGIESSMKMLLEQRRQAMLQLHLSDQQFHCLIRCVLHHRLYGTYLLIYAGCYVNDRVIGSPKLIYPHMLSLHTYPWKAGLCIFNCSAVLWCASIIEYVMIRWSYYFVCTLHYRMIIILQMCLKVLCVYLLWIFHFVQNSLEYNK